MNKLLTIVLILAATTAEAQTLKVMTYNIRFDNANDGVNRWSNRKDKLTGLIQKYDPDLIGLQEALLSQIQDIITPLPQYQYVGVGRDDGKEKGEFSCILYRKDKFDLINTETRWLSETPTVPGSKNWDAAITRVVTQATLRDKKSKKEFIHFNTHFDHIGKEARLNSARIIREWIAKDANKLPAIVTGDFNAEPTEPPYAEMLKDKVVKDTRPKDLSVGTFCNFGVNSQPCRLIDYIFCTNSWRVGKYQVIQDNDGANYPSDHLPVMVELK